ncbi:MAG: hypothetical protein ACYTFQ_27125, partial [Planctomycetota bacterium]
MMTAASLFYDAIALFVTPFHICGFRNAPVAKLAWGDAVSLQEIPEPCPTLSCLLGSAGHITLLFS